MKKWILILVSCSFFACNSTENPTKATSREAGTEAEIAAPTGTFLVVLGTVQDAGAPHIACQRDCCAALFTDPDPRRQVVALGLVDRASQARFLFEATPDMPRQMKTLTQLGKGYGAELADGIFLTHAHIGHYAGLMYLGKEAVDASGVPVYAMPRMRQFLTDHGPWSQLVSRGNIQLRELSADVPVAVSEQVQVTPIRVPHRDEYSETVGYRIEGPQKSALFIPDIDKWEKWDRDIVAEIRRVDYAFLDATFYDAAEVNYRDISQIPHPFVSESMDQFSVLDAAERQKVIFIHLNHTNPLLDPASAASEYVESRGFQVARWGQVYSL